MSQIFPRVSIVTGTYNSMKYLDRLIDSVQAQTFTDWEMIFVDDGSHDGTREYLARFCEENRKFRLILKTPEGSPAKSRIVALEAARGEYIAFCDHDDFWAPDKLQIQIEAYRQYPDAAIVHTQRTLWYDAGRPKVYPRYEVKGDTFQIQSPHKVLYTGPKILFSSFMTKKSYLDKVGGLHPDLLGIDDYHIFLKLSEIGRILRVELPLTYYYEHQNNLSRVDNIFVDGYFRVLEALKDEGASNKLVRVVSAHAFKSKGVTYLKDKPLKAFCYFGKSLFSFFLVRTLVLFTLSLGLTLVPSTVRSRFLQKVMKIKEKTPTLEDYVMRTKNKGAQG